MSALWSAAKLRAATQGRMAADFSAAGVSIDTRTLQPGDLFIALVGENGDGHAHVVRALELGAAGAMVHARPAGLAADAPLLEVADTLAGLTDLGRHARARFRGRVIAVTGSVGKTTTKEMLRLALAALGTTEASVASYNNHWGVPLTLARLPPDADFAVVEIGMNHAGEIGPLSRLARPDVALVTNVGVAHIGHLGSIEAIAREKAAIGEGLDPDGTLVLPAEGPLHLLRRPEVRTMLFGDAVQADGRVAAIALDPDGSDIVAEIAGERVAFRLAAPGGHMAMNAVAALCGVRALGGALAPAAAALALFSAGAGRGQRRSIAAAGGEAMLLDESYNASPAAMRAALELLRLQPGRRHIAVLGDMLELGAAGPAEHAGLAPDVMRSADTLFACGPLMRGLFDTLPPTKRGGYAADSAELAPSIAAALRDGDVVLVKGSLGSRMARIVGALDAVAEAA